MTDAMFATLNTQCRGFVRSMINSEQAQLDGKKLVELALAKLNEIARRRGLMFTATCYSLMCGYFRVDHQQVVLDTSRRLGPMRIPYSEIAMCYISTWDVMAANLAVPDKDAFALQCYNVILRSDQVATFLFASIIRCRRQRRRHRGKPQAVVHLPDELLRMITDEFVLGIPP